MKAVSTLCFALAAAVSASPLQARDSGSVTFALSNDMTGAYATAKIATDNLPHSIGVYFAGSPVMVDYKILASSAQLATVPAGINCVLTNNGATIATLTEQATYADLDGNPNQLIPVTLSEGRITCSV